MMPKRGPEQGCALWGGSPGRLPGGNDTQVKHADRREHPQLLASAPGSILTQPGGCSWVATCAQRPQAHLIHTAQWGHVHSLPPHCSSSPNAGRVLPGAAVDDGVYQDLQGVLGDAGGRP